jgi:hypothetical protein
MRTEADTDLECLVQAIRARKLVEPAIFILEMSKPLVGCAREIYKVGEPLMRMFVSPAFAPALERVLSSSENVELLIRRLEDSKGIEA